MVQARAARICSGGVRTGTGVGDEGAEQDAAGHREEDPEGEEAVEEAEGLEGGDFAVGGGDCAGTWEG